MPTRATTLLLLPFAAALSMGATCDSPTRNFNFGELKDRCNGLFRLESGDVIRVHVWNEPNHSRDQVLVRPDGKISLPLVGDIQAAGMTIRDAGNVIKRKVQAFVPNPRVDVSLVTARSYMFFVMGEVRRTGMFSSQSQVDVLQALSHAGGFTPFAKTDRIFIIWKSPKGERRIPFSYDEVIKGIASEQNIQLCRGDVVMVP
jgi:polysaccharide biosynthesis/export protein